MLFDNARAVSERQPSAQVGGGYLGPEMPQLLGHGFIGHFLRVLQGLQLRHPLLGVGMAQAVGAGAPAQGGLGGAGHRHAPGLATADGVVLLVVHVPIGHRARGGEPLRL